MFSKNEKAYIVFDKETNDVIWANADWDITSFG